MLRKKKIEETPVAVQEPEDKDPQTATELAAKIAEIPEAKSIPVPQPPARPMVPAARIVVRVDRLREALAILAPAIPKRPALPVTEFVRLGGGRVRATSLEVAISMALPEAKQELLLPHRATSELLKYIPGHQEATIETHNWQVRLESGGSHATFPTEAPDKFPPLPELKESERGMLPGDDLVKALVAVLPYVAKDDSRPMLTAVALERGEQVKAVASDGFRLAWEDVRGRLEGKGMLPIPGQSVALLAKLWKQRPSAPDFQGDYDPVKVATARRMLLLEWTKTRLKVRFGGDRDLVVITQLVGVDYPNYRQVIPKPNERSFQAIGSDLLLALKQLSRVANEGSGVLRLQWESDKLRLSVGDEENQMQVTVAVQTREPGRIALQASYLMDYVRGKDGMVGLAMSGDERCAAVLTYQGRTNHTIMLMFVQWS